MNRTVPGGVSGAEWTSAPLCYRNRRTDPLVWIGYVSGNFCVIDAAERDRDLAAYRLKGVGEQA